MRKQFFGLNLFSAISAVSASTGHGFFYGALSRPVQAIMWTTVRYLWAFPTTAVGLVLVLPTLLTGGRGQFVAGVLELHGGCVRWMLTHLVPLPGGASALTLGHVVVARDEECHERTRTHERVHVRQVERWGMFFIPAYFLCSFWMLLRGRNPYRDNPFEAEAYRLEAEFNDGC